MAEHEPQPDNSDRVAQPEPQRDQDQDSPLDGLDAETVEDLDVDEDAEDVQGGTHTWVTACPSIPPCMTQ